MPTDNDSLGIYDTLPRTAGQTRESRPDGAAGGGGLLGGLPASADPARERRRLWRDKAQAAQEIRLLGEMLDAVAAATSLPAVVDATGHGIKDLLPQQRWSLAQLLLLAEDGRSVEVHDLGHAPIDSYWRNVRTGAVAAARELGVEVDVDLVAEAEQERCIEEGVRRGVDGIAVAPSDAAALEPAIRRARQAGVPVITFDTPPVEGSEALLYIGTDNLAAGRLAGEAMAALLPDGGAVAVLTGTMRSLNARLRLQGFTEALEGRGFTVLPPLEDGRDGRAGRAAAAALLRERRDVAGALGIFDDSGPTWAAAARLAGRGDDLKVVGFDLNADTLAMLMRGSIHATVAQHEQEMGAVSVEVLFRMASVGLAQALAELPPSRFLDTGGELVTLEPGRGSTALSDFLMRLSVGRRALSGGLAARSRRRLRFLVIGMASAEPRADARRVPFQEESLLGEVRRVWAPLLVDAEDPLCDRLDDLRALRERGVRTVIASPLLATGAPLGALLLGSEQELVYRTADLVRVERVARAAAVAIQNSQLLGELTARSEALGRAAAEQAALLENQAALLATIEEMSTPVVPVAPGVLVLPLVGTLDERRCARFLEVLLGEIDDHAARAVLIDVTGAVGIDAAAAASLARAAQAARLLGAEVVLVGVGAAAARSMIERGLDLGDIVTRSTLQDGLAHALGQLGGRLVLPR